MQLDLLEEITALVDGEITDKKRMRELSELINNDEKLALEKFIQSSIKNVCRKKSAYIKIPISLAESIKHKLLSL